MQEVPVYSEYSVSGERIGFSTNLPGFTHGGWRVVVWAAVTNRWAIRFK